MQHKQHIKPQEQVIGRWLKVLESQVSRPRNSGRSWEPRSKKQNQGGRNFCTKFTVFGCEFSY